jgi:parvulin-like peptidyl-prolyl isomerase
MASSSFRPITSESIVAYLKKNIGIRDTYRKILSQEIIDRAAREKGLSVKPEEIQKEADRVRRQKRLEKAAETFAWLTEEMISPDDWEAGIKDFVIRHKLAQTLFAEEAQKHFAQNRLDYEQVLLYQLVVPYERLAIELLYQIEEEEISFYEAAHLYDIDEKRRHQCGCEGKLFRWSLNPKISALIFSSPAGQVVGPVKTDLGYHLIKVEEIIQAELTPQIHQEIIDKLFESWLEGEINYRFYNQAEPNSPSAPNSNPANQTSNSAPNPPSQVYNHSN